eukprot:647973-Prymnesium_polylepis.1
MRAPGLRRDSAASRRDHTRSFTHRSDQQDPTRDCQLAVHLERLPPEGRVLPPDKNAVASLSGVRMPVWKACRLDHSSAA